MQDMTSQRVQKSVLECLLSCGMQSLHAFSIMLSPRLATPARSFLPRLPPPTILFSVDPAPPIFPSGQPPPCPAYETNTQLRQLIKSGRLTDARHLFDVMPQRDVVSYTTIISGYVAASDASEALLLFSRMRGDPDPLLFPDPFVLSVALKACGSSPSLRPHGESLHALTLKYGSHPSSVFVGSALLDMYSRAAHDPSSALRVFDEMPLRNVVSWTSAVTALVRAGRFRDALRLFSDMGVSGTPYDSHTYAIALKACSDAGLLDCGREIHAHAAKLGMDSTSFVANSLATLYCRSGHLRRGLLLFERMNSPDVVAWTTVISTYVQLGREEDAVHSFLVMENGPSGVSPNEYTYAAVVAACTGLSRVPWGEQVHARVARRGIAGAMSVANALVTMYSRAGRLAAADTLFREMTCKDIVSWTAIISAYSQEGLVVEACNLFDEMRHSGPQANEFTLASLISSCACAALLGPGRQLHGYALAAGVDGDVMVGSSLITMYSKCGSMQEAARVFDERRRDNVVSWTAMINGYAEHGRSIEAIELFNEMPAAGLKPDYVTLIGVLVACGHAGMVELGRKYFATMTEKYGIEAGREHYGCMVDLLGRAGKLVEAEQMIEGMPRGLADEVVWTALLRACGARGDSERGQRVAGRVLELEPGCAGAHIAMSNMYAAKGRWGEAAEMRVAMRSKGVRKEAGWSWVELAGDGVVVFVAGERSHHLRGKELYAMLELVAYEAGYAPEFESLWGN